MIKRLFDLLTSFFALILLLPILIIIGLLICIDSKGGPFYKQTRIGYQGQPFKLLKFRTMRNIQGKDSLLTLGDRDPRVTKIGYYLRKYKVDELMQLWNILRGEMSFVGPRPEVPKYVAYYSEEQRKVLSVRPGLTDIASIKFRDESELLKERTNPEEYYINVIMPKKLKYNILYLEKASFLYDLNLILKTIIRVVK